MYEFANITQIATSRVIEMLFEKITDRSSRSDNPHGGAVMIGAPDQSAENLEGTQNIINLLNMHNTTTQTFQKSENQDMSFFSSLFGGKSNSVECGIIRETKRYMREKITVNEIEDIWEVGVSLRMLVATTSSNLEVDLTIPNIAAKAQLNEASAKIGISVTGFNGNLGGMLPDVTFLNVEKFDEYMGAFRKLEAHIFSENSEKYFSPMPLGRYLADT